MDEGKIQFLFKLPVIAGLVTMLVGGAITKLGFLKPETLLPLMLVGLTFIATDLLIYNFSRDKDRESILKPITNIRDTLRRIEETQSRNIRMMQTPSEAKEYIELWGGFETGEYIAFNPSFQLEPKYSNSSQEDIIKNVFVPRYRNQDFKEARYLFFLKDDAGKEDYAKFREIMKKVKGHSPEVDKKLHVKITEEKCAKDYPEFYLGKQRGSETCIIEPMPSDNVLSRGRGDSRYYFITNDNQLCREYRNQFESEWKNAKVVKDSFR
jgi:hypothetical protein